MKPRVAVTLVLVLAACGSDESIPVDARRGIDAPPSTPDAPMIDAPPGTPDAPMIDAPPGTPDAALSSVVVTPGACPNTPTISLETVGIAFQIVGQDVNNPPLVISAGQSIQFHSNAANHNFISAAGTPALYTFESGTPSIHTACLTFGLAGAVTYRCAIHATMTGSLTIN